MKPVFEDNVKFQEFIKKPAIRPIVFLVLKFYTIVLAGYCLVPFAFLSVHKWWFIYTKLYFAGFIWLLPASFVYKPLIAKVVAFYFPKDKEPAKLADAMQTEASKPLVTQASAHEKVN